MNNILHMVLSHHFLLEFSLNCSTLLFVSDPMKDSLISVLLNLELNILIGFSESFYPDNGKED